MTTGVTFQIDALQHVNESASQWKICRCPESDGNLWACKASDNHEKQVSARCPNCQNLQVFKCGPLLISSKGIGWTSWKKRWFILTRASLVFFRSDPNAPTQRGSEVNLTLGGIELNNSGSVVVRADKKLLTVLFPDGRDGRAFTLKAETSEDMHEWRIALECALSLAPSAALVMGGQSSIFQNDVTETVDCPVEECQDRGLEISTVIENPISLDLEDDEGNPSFLEKAIRFIEQYGVNVEGILRQSADVEEVERRVEEYKQGKNEFSSNEDAHVIGDCIKHVLRELPSSPVPASCCTALLEAFRGDCGSRVNNIRSVIFETFPEPNRYLLQRILKMMQIVASHKSENRMSLSAVAACMAPLLLRPLLAGDCELEDDFHMGGDGSVQLLQAAAAANHAQAIVIILLEHYERIFSGETLQYSSSELYSETEGSEEEEYDYDDEDSTENEIVQENGYHDADDDFNAESEADNECTSSGEHDESSSDFGGDLSDNKATDCQYSDNSSSKTNENPEANTKVDLKQDLTLLDDVCEKQSKESPQAPQNSTEHSKSILDQNSSTFSACINDAPESSGYIPTSESPTFDAVSHALCNSKTTDKTKEPGSGKRTAVWGRTSARKNLSMENIDYHSDDENAVQRLEAIKSDLESKLTEEVKENELLQSSLELRKQALHNHRIALQQDVERLILQLENERALRASLEAGLLNMQPGLPISAAVDSKTKKNLEEIAVAEADISHLKQEVIDLQGKINQQKLQISDFTCESCGQNLSKSLQSNTKNGHGDVSLKIAPRRSEKSRSSEDISSALVSSNENTQMLDASALQNMQKSASLGSTKSTETYSSIHEQSLTEVNVVSRDCSKAEIASSASLRQKQPPRKQRHSLIRSTKSLSPANSTSREAPTHTSRRTSPKGEDTVSGSASALTRLTNRLNFLKERRVQLVNEIQVVDTSHAKGSKCPPRTNSR